VAAATSTTAVSDMATSSSTVEATTCTTRITASTADQRQNSGKLLHFQCPCPTMAVAGAADFRPLRHPTSTLIPVVVVVAWLSCHGVTSRLVVTAAVGASASKKFENLSLTNLSNQRLRRLLTLPSTAIRPARRSTDALLPQDVHQRFRVQPAALRSQRHSVVVVVVVVGARTGTRRSELRLPSWRALHQRRLPHRRSS
jgi:hypothetical protein